MLLAGILRVILWGGGPVQVWHDSRALAHLPPPASPTPCLRRADEKRQKDLAGSLAALVRSILQAR